MARHGTDGRSRLSRRTLLQGGVVAGAFAASPGLLAGCGPSGGGGGSGSRLTIAVEGDAHSLNEIVDPGLGIRILNNTQDGLLNRSVDYREVVPGLAELPEQPDDLTYRFTLKEGVTFHTGDPVTAEDVVYTYNRLMTDEMASFGALYRDNLESVEAEDDRTVVIRTKQPFPIFLSLASGNHTKIVQRKKTENPDYGVSVFSGTGPFQIVEWVRGDHITIRKAEHANSPQGEAQVDEVVFRVMVEPAARLAALRAGQVDAVIQPAYKDLAQFRDSSDYQITETESADLTLMLFKTSMPPFDLREVRKALSIGIDRQALVDNFFHGHANVAGDLYPSWHWAHDPSITEPYDPAGARELLAEAGFDEGNPLSFTCMVLQDQLFLDQATAIQAQLREIGVEMAIQAVEYSTLSGITASGPEDWLGPAAMLRITPIRGTAYEFSYYQYASGGPLNRTDFNKPGGHQRPDIEELLLESIAEADWGPERNQAVKPDLAELSRMINDDPPQLRLNFWNRVSLLTDQVENWSSAVFDLIQLAPVSMSD